MQDWLGDAKKASRSVPKYFHTKLLFAKNDILRSALPTMRMCQSLETLNRNGVGEGGRVTLSPHELMCGVRCCGNLVERKRAGQADSGTPGVKESLQLMEAPFSGAAGCLAAVA